MLKNETSQAKRTLRTSWSSLGKAQRANDNKGLAGKEPISTQGVLEVLLGGTRERMFLTFCLNLAVRAHT